MPDIKLEHFKRAAADIAAHGDNDTLPFDIDNRFIAENQDALVDLAFRFSQELESVNNAHAHNIIDSLPVFSERLLAPTGSTGFRITTKIHPFWNIYFNGLGVCIAEVNEPKRSPRAHSYRFVNTGDGLFDRAASWRAFREITVSDCEAHGENPAVVVQTDISSFYEHIYHHRLENLIDDLFPQGSTVGTQIDRFLNKFSSGRSFGLPVGGQCSRILAEVVMSAIDQRLSDQKIVWRRYVDDFVLITSSQADAYRALSVLSHALADYGLTLNRTKTTLLTANHYIDYVRAQLGDAQDEAGKLAEIDLHFDPYSDTPDSDYDELRHVVESLNVGALLDLELHKAQPDTFLVAQIGKTLKLHSPGVALQLCRTLLAATNLHSFRASWSKIMRGVSSVRADDVFKDIFDGLDDLLDAIPEHSPHLLLAEANCLHYLRTIRFRRTDRRARFVSGLYQSTGSVTVKRACTECWRHWKDRPSFTSQRNFWDKMNPEEQRILWLAALEFDDEGEKFRQQKKSSLDQSWKIGIERKGQQSTFGSIYSKWTPNGA